MKKYFEFSLEKTLKNHGLCESGKVGTLMKSIWMAVRTGIRIRQCKT